MKKHYELDYGPTDYNPIYLMNGDNKDLVLRTSPLDKGWSKSGEVVCTLKDTGDGLTLKIYERTIELNYLEGEIIRLALKLNEPNVKLFEIVKKARR